MSVDDATKKRVVEVKASESSYEVIIEEGLISKLEFYVKDALDKQGFSSVDSIFIISDSNVWEIYGEGVKTTLLKLRGKVNHFVFETGEKSKNPKTLFECVEKMGEAGCSRDTLVINLGGGVACDLGGFAAATYMRGVKHIAIPTSLLAMVDASVGGKTAVDLPCGKNLFGAFHQPIAVFVDPKVLSTLSDEEFRDSIGEVVKHSILANEEMFNFLHDNKLDKTYVGTQVLNDIIYKNIEIKNEIVSNDEFESGVRQTLNLGHTIGHAVELAQNFELGHGSCVAIGLCMIAKALANSEIIEQSVSSKIEQAFKTQGLPTSTDVSIEEILRLVKNDKKRHGESLNVIVPKKIGDSEVMNFSFEEFDKLMEKY